MFSKEISNFVKCFLKNTNVSGLSPFFSMRKKPLYSTTQQPRLSKSNRLLFVSKSLLRKRPINLQAILVLCRYCVGGQRWRLWRSSESARLPPMWSRCKSQSWVEFVVGSVLCSKRFFSRFSGFSLCSRINIFKF